jgi:hypothetical protein
MIFPTESFNSDDDADAQFYRMNPTEEAVPVVNPSQTVRRSGRSAAVNRPNYAEFAFVADLDQEPATYWQAKTSDEWPFWQKAIDEEINSLEKNRTWEIVPKKSNLRMLPCKWVFKLKKDADGTPVRYKARLVAKGFNQKEGVDFKETFAPVAKMTTVRILLSLACKYRWHVCQLDVKTAFLYGDLTEEIYLLPPQGYNVQPDQVLRLKKSLYGLKQSPRCWYLKLHSWLLNFGFSRCAAEHSVYVLTNGSDQVILTVYVDDILLFSSSEILVNRVKKEMKNRFEMTDMGQPQYFLGIEICYDRSAGSLSLTQRGYAKRVLERFEFLDAKPVATPMDLNVKLTKPDEDELELGNPDFPFREILGCLMYLMVGTRPDLASAIGILGRFATCFGTDHEVAIKRVLRYLRGTADASLLYKPTPAEEEKITAYADADFASCGDTRKSNSGYVVLLNGCLVSWCSKKQSVVALSSTEAEYYALAESMKECIWTSSLIRELGLQDARFTVFEDNQSCIQLSNNPVKHGRTKHIDVRHHFIRNLLEDEKAVLTYVPSAENLADMFTKPLAKNDFEAARRRLGIVVVLRGSVEKPLVPSE